MGVTAFVVPKPTWGPQDQVPRPRGAIATKAESVTVVTPTTQLGRVARRETHFEALVP